MTTYIYIADTVLMAYDRYVDKAICPDQLGLTFSKDELTKACVFLTLFDLIENETKGVDGFLTYKITVTGTNVAKNDGGLKEYLNELDTKL